MAFGYREASAGCGGRRVAGGYWASSNGPALGFAAIVPVTEHPMAWFTKRGESPCQARFGSAAIPRRYSGYITPKDMLAGLSRRSTPTGSEVGRRENSGGQFAGSSLREERRCPIRAADC